MDFRKIKTETTVVTRQKDQFYRGTGNIYETRDKNGFTIIGVTDFLLRYIK